MPPLLSDMAHFSFRKRPKMSTNPAGKQQKIGRVMGGGPLSNELLKEMATFVRLKIVHKTCVGPANVSLLLTNTTLTSYLRLTINKLLQKISELSSEDAYRNDENKLSITNADGTALCSLDLLRHICLNNVLLQRRGAYTIKGKTLPADFKPLPFIGALMKYAATSPNPWTIAERVVLEFPPIDEKEFLDFLKVEREDDEEELSPELAAHFRKIRTLACVNGNQKLEFSFCRSRTWVELHRTEIDHHSTT